MAYAPLGTTRHKSSQVCGWADLVEVADDFVEQTDTLDAVPTDGVLSTKLPELGNRREHHDDGVVSLVVKILTSNETKHTSSVQML